MCKPFDSYFLVQDTEEYEQELDLEVLQSTKYQGLFVDWPSLAFLAVPPANRLLFVCAFVRVLDRE